MADDEARFRVVLDKQETKAARSLRNIENEIGRVRLAGMQSLRHCRGVVAGASKGEPAFRRRIIAAPGFIHEQDSAAVRSAAQFSPLGRNPDSAFEDSVAPRWAVPLALFERKTAYLFAASELCSAVPKSVPQSFALAPRRSETLAPATTPRTSQAREGALFASPKLR